MPWRCSSPRVTRVSSASTTSASPSSRSTRRVTSSRLPIGVAQTESTSGDRVEGDQAGADDARLLAELRRLDPRPARAGQRLYLQHLLHARDELVERGDPEAAANHDE